MSMNDPLADLKILLKSRYGLMILATGDQARATALLRHGADALNMPYFLWTSSKGLQRNGTFPPMYDTDKPLKALQNIEQNPLPALYHMEGLELYLEDPILIQQLKQTAEALATRDAAIIISAADCVLPERLQAVSATIHLPELTLQDYRRLLYDIIKDISTKMKLQITLTPEQGNQLLNNLKGLSLMEANKTLTRIMVEEGRLDVDDIEKVILAKKDILLRDGLLEYFYPSEEALSNIADMAGLKGWLTKRRDIVVNPDQATSFGLTFPKGILLLGVQGCGKSLCAKAVSVEWKLPLLKLDPSNLYNKYVGESERNFKRAMAMAEKLAPVILWIDEIEKAFSSSQDNSDGGLSLRILGTFLNWMQERKAPVFIMATANNIEKLPPEFLRKGRFDEIFFVDLPSAEGRRRVFEIHLKKRGRDLNLFNLPTLVQASDGFSPAEIEQAIVSGLYSAYSKKIDLTTDLLLEEIRATRPLSVTMSEKITALREWARERTVSAQ